MAGVEVEVSADFGWAWAKISFGANALLYFDPFYFQATIYARISAGVKVDTFLGTISFSITVGASVTVWGPDFSGRASLEVGPCTVTVPFGSQAKVEGVTLAWAEFVAKYLEDAGDGVARVLSAITGRGTLPAATGGARSAPTADGTKDRPFEVFAEFEITVVTTVPTGRIDLGLASGAVVAPVTRSDGAGAALGLKPMSAGGLASALLIRLHRKDPAGGTCPGCRRRRCRRATCCSRRTRSGWWPRPPPSRAAPRSTTTASRCPAGRCRCRPAARPAVTCSPRPAPCRCPR